MATTRSAVTTVDGKQISSSKLRGVFTSTFPALWRLRLLFSAGRVEGGAAFAPLAALLAPHAIRRLISHSTLDALCFTRFPRRVILLFYFFVSCARRRAVVSTGRADTCFSFQRRTTVPLPHIACTQTVALVGKAWGGGLILTFCRLHTRRNKMLLVMCLYLGYCLTTFVFLFL